MHGSPSSVQCTIFNMQAHAAGMRFPRYVWLTYSDELEDFVGSERPQCEGEVDTLALEGLFTLRSGSSSTETNDNPQSVSVYTEEKKHYSGQGTSW